MGRFPSDAQDLLPRRDREPFVGVADQRRIPLGGLRPAFFFRVSKPTNPCECKTSKTPAFSCVMLRRSRSDTRETPEPEDLPDLEAERAFANAIIADGLKRNPERAREVIAQVTHTFAESGRYSAEEVSAAIDQLLGELEAHDQPRH
jgi:hypothetical protein